MNHSNLGKWGPNIKKKKRKNCTFVFTDYFVTLISFLTIQVTWSFLVIMLLPPQKFSFHSPSLFVSQARSTTGSIQNCNIHFLAGMILHFGRFLCVVNSSFSLFLHPSCASVLLEFTVAMHVMAISKNFFVWGKWIYPNQKILVYIIQDWKRVILFRKK